MTLRTIRRFYKDVTTAARGDGHAILLDGKPIKTPGGLHLVVPTAALANAIAKEWEGQGERIDPAAMPLTNLAYGAVEGIPRDREKIIEHILGFARSDLVCNRADTPPELVQRQAQIWDPLLEWLAETHAIRLQVGEGLAYINQPEGMLLRVEKIVCALDDFQLAGLDRLAALAGSFLVGFAVLQGQLAAQEASDVAHVDEHFQAEKWGQDPAAEARRKQIQAEMQAAGEFLKLSAVAKT